MFNMFFMLCIALTGPLTTSVALMVSIPGAGAADWYVLAWVVFDRIFYLH